MERYPVVVIGAGQAGLAVSHGLASAGVGHVVLERGRVGEAWRSRRWDSFTLVTPNWAILLPGFGYRGPDPDGYLKRADVVAYLEVYAGSFAAPVRQGAEVWKLRSGPDGFTVVTTEGVLSAGQVVVATGAFQEPHIPPVGAGLDPGVRQLHTAGYRAPDQLADGDVLLVGSGQSGCQIAEELQQAGRQVYLACGSCGWAHRRYGDHDLMWWLHHSGMWDDPVGSLPSPALKFACNPQVTGAHGGRDLNLRTLTAAGVRLLGRVTAMHGSRVECSPDLAGLVAKGDEWAATLHRRFAEYARQAGLPVPEDQPPGPIKADPLTELDLAARGIRTVIWATGYRPAFGWIELPVFQEDGYPRQTKGVSEYPGLYFVGLNWLSKRKSGLLSGVGEDAAHVAKAVAASSG